MHKRGNHWGSRGGIIGALEENHWCTRGVIVGVLEG